MTREELIELARPMDIADGTEEELHKILDRLESELPHGDIVSLLFQKSPELTIEEAVDEALRRESAWLAGQT